MTEYRITKDGREFVAQEFDTLRELLQRGLLSADDVVSVDGGESRPLSALGLSVGVPSLPPRAAAAPRSRPLGRTIPRREPGPIAPPEDHVAAEAPGPHGPWRHWEGARAREASGDVLSDFLADVDGAPGFPPASESRGRARSQPPTSSPSDPSPPSDMQRLDASDLAPLDAEPAPARPMLRIVEPPSDSPRSTETNGGSEAPLSFTDWVDERAEGRGADLLEHFGRENDGIVLTARRSRGPNWWRTCGFVFVAALGIGGASTWVRTVAQTHYPKESELIASRRGDGPSLPGEPTPSTRPEVAPDTARDNERRLRAMVAGDVARFGSAEQLENVLFQEFSNLHLRPQRVRVTATRVQGSGDVDRARPLEADIAVVLSGVAGEGGSDAQVEAIHERRLLVWLVLGKYGVQGKIALGAVTTEFTAPSAMADRRDGKDLLKLWTGRASATDLLLADP